MTRRKHTEVVSLAEERARRATAFIHRTQAIATLEYARNQLEFNPGAAEFADVADHMVAELTAAIKQLRSGYRRGV